MKYIIAIIVIVAIGALSLYISVGDELSDVVDALLSVKPGYLVVMLLLMLGYYIVDGRIMQVIARQYNKDYSLKQGFVNNMVGIFFSDLTPSATGGQFAQVYVFRHQGVSGTCASGILIMALISYQIVIVVYAAVCMLLRSDLIFSGGVGTKIIAAIGFAVNIGVTAVLFIGSASKKLQNFFINRCIKGLSKLHIVKDYEKTSKNLRSVFKEFRIKSKALFSNKKLFFTTLFLNALKLTMLYSIPFFSFLAVGAKLDITRFPELLALASAVTMFNTFMPIPGASGGSEGSYMLLYSYLGSYLATSSMLVWRVVTFYVGLLIGFVILIVSKDVRGYHGQEMEDIEDDSCSENNTEE
ncbi:MAG: flippase-like domain-containing protein [Lachnospiraceae bacterium]|nr:flippase-like domain-containing protein [Lachnospiraceae bacterium]